MFKILEIFPEYLFNTFNIFILFFVACLIPFSIFMNIKNYNNFNNSLLLTNENYSKLPIYKKNKFTKITCINCGNHIDYILYGINYSYIYNPHQIPVFICRYPECLKKLIE